MNYEDFLKQKQIKIQDSGFETTFPINEMLFPFQKEIVHWALKKGKAAVFADCGLGKTPIQLEWARQVHLYTKGNVIIFAPLTVSKQTKREGDKFNIKVNICESQEDVISGINITNYEKLHKFDLTKFAGIVLDESGILKSYMGSFKRELIRLCRGIPYKLACTATPAPNDHMEILNHGEFLNAMKSHEALAIWFINDTMQAGSHRLKKHAIKDFWEWVSTWGVAMSKPSDIGHCDDGYILPKLNVHENIIEISEFDFSKGDGSFLRDVEMNATSYNKEKKNTAEDRINATAGIVNNSKEQFVVWCERNYEADLLKKRIPDAIEVRGNDKPEKKEQTALDFIDKKVRVLISKPSIFGYGLNFQSCYNTVFCGLSFSYESYYQAVRRFWRFGQENEVNVHVVIGSSEMKVLETIKRKESLHKEMQKNMYGGLKDIQYQNFKKTEYKIDFERNEEIQMPKWLINTNKKEM